MKKILIVIGILLLSLNIQAQSPGIFSFVIVRDSLCLSQGGGLDCLTFIMGDSTVSPEWVRDYVRDNTGVPDSVNIVYLTVSGSAFIDSLYLDYLSIGDSPGVDTIITLKDAVNAEQFDSIHVDTAHVDHELFVRDTTIVELIETHGSGEPGGASGSLQYNNAGVFDGAPLTTDGTDITLPSGNRFNHTLGIEDTSLVFINNDEGILMYIENNSLGIPLKIVNTDQNGYGILVEDISGAISGAKLIQVTKEGKVIFQVLDDSTTYIYNIEIEESLNIADSTFIGKDSLYTKLKVVSKQFAGQLVVSTPLTLSLAVDDQFYTLTGLTSDIEENTTLTNSTITIGTQGYGLYHFLITLTVQHTAINSEITCSIFLNDVETDATETQTVNGAGEPFGYSIQGLAWLSPGDVIKVRFASDNNGTLTINRGNFHVIRN